MQQMLHMQAALIRVFGYKQFGGKVGLIGNIGTGVVVGSVITGPPGAIL